MKKTTTAAVATLALGLALSACATDADGVATPAPMTETVESVEEEATPDPVEDKALSDSHNSFHSDPYTPKPKPASDDGLSDSNLREIGKLAIELAWNDMNFSEQEDICWLFDLDEGAVLDAFMDVEDNVLSRSDVRSFFAGKC